MEKDINSKFECRFIKNPKKLISASFKTGRSLHGARILKPVEDDAQADIVATLSEDRADSAYIINAIDENKTPKVLVGNTLLKVVERGNIGFYFCLNNKGNREMKIDLGNGLESGKSVVYKIDVEESFKEGTIKANAVNPNLEEHSTCAYISNALSEKEAEA